MYSRFFGFVGLKRKVFLALLPILVALMIVLYFLDPRNDRARDNGAKFDQQVNPGCKQRTLQAYRPMTKVGDYYHPSRVHYAKFVSTHKGTLKFLEYMSMLSVYKTLRPEIIYIHSNRQFEGKYWDLTQKWFNTTVKVNYVLNITHFGRTRLRFIEHLADYTKLSEVLKHGGLAIDFDVIMINGHKLQRLQSISECVLVQEDKSMRISFFSCMKNAPFIKAMVKSYHTDYRRIWVYNAGTIPTKLLLDKKRKDCFNVHVDNEICKPNYPQAYEKWMRHGGVNWKTKIAAHYYKRYLKLTKEDESLLEKDTSFSEMLRTIYKL